MPSHDLNSSDLETLLSRHSPPVAKLTRRLIAVIGTVSPALEGTVRPGWGSVNFKHPRAGLICAIFPLPAEVRLVFEHGRLLSNASGLLEGDQRQIRSIYLRPGRKIPETELALLLAEAVALRL